MAAKFSMKNGIFNKEGAKNIKWLFAWLVSLALFAMCEKFIPAEICTAVHSPLDDLIPFCEYFVVFYLLWHALIAALLVYFALYSRESFRALLIFMTVCQLLAILIFILFPNRQDLRPEAMPRDNIFSRIVALVYSADTNTNVCPSLHVAVSLGMLSVFWKDENSGRQARVIALLLCIGICLSTVFIKQHSVIDSIVALIICIPAEALAFVDF